MKGNAVELPCHTNVPLNNSKKLILSILTLVLLTTVPLYVKNCPSSPLSLEVNINGLIPQHHETHRLRSTVNESRTCNMFTGDWVPHRKGPYYTNLTNCVIDDRQNCMKFGRPDTEFLYWRWKPDECNLPLFDAKQFLEIVRGKTLAFVGDSVGRNQMQSLVCLLASAANPVDATYVDDTRFRRWFYKDYNFTIAALWSPLLVKAREADPNGYSFTSLMNLYLDEVDDAWAAHLHNVNIVIFSAGQWFFRPFVYYEKGSVIGCHTCNNKTMSEVTEYYAYRMAFRTAFRTLLSLQNFRGLTILRTFSPAHFENGDWNKGGYCARTRPLTRQETKIEVYKLEFYLTQVEEFRAAERKGKRRGLKFRLLDTTEAMEMRPDGHPNHYGHLPNKNKTVADCVHWCMPGPVDTWNEFLLQVLKEEGGGINQEIASRDLLIGN